MNADSLWEQDAAGSNAVIPTKYRSQDLLGTVRVAYKMV
jgi:hypothetical protein